MEHDDFDHGGPASDSFLVWIFKALGFRYTVALPLLGIIAFVLVLLAILKFKTPALTAIMLAVIPLPVLFGVIGFFDGLFASWQVISLSGATPKMSEYAYGTSMALVSIQVGLVLSLPAYLLGVGGLVYRAFSHAEVEPDWHAKEPPIGAQLVR